MDEETLDDIRDDVERTRGIEEGEADHRIDEFRDLVRRLEDLETMIREGFSNLEARVGAAASIAIDNGAAPAEAAGESVNDDIVIENDEIDTEFLEKDWDDLAEALTL